jgi:hypothetical protein
MTKCILCSNEAIRNNAQGSPVCGLHKRYGFLLRKCPICNSKIILVKSKNPYFKCELCGSLPIKKLTKIDVKATRFYTSGEILSNLLTKKKYYDISITDFKGKDGCYYLAKEMMERSEEFGIILNRKSTLPAYLYSLISKENKKYLHWASPRFSLNKYFDIKHKLIENLDEYKGINGMINLAKEMKVNYLCSLFSAFGHINNINWSHINLDVKDYENGLTILSKNKESYKGEKGLIKFSKVLGIKNLGALCSAFNNKFDLEWPNIRLTADKYLKAKKLMKAKEYKGSTEILKLAEEIDINYLDSLSALRKFNLKIKHLPITKDQYKEGLELLKKNTDKYIRTQGMINLSKELEIENLSTTYKVFNLPNLEWKLIPLDYPSYEKALKILQKDHDSFKENIGLFNLAKKVKINNVFGLYVAFKDKFDLSWKRISLSLDKYLLAEEKLQTNTQKYIGVEGLIKLAKEIKIQNPSTLYLLFGKSYGIGWKHIKISIPNYLKAKKILNSDKSKYKGIKGMALFCKETNISNLEFAYQAFDNKELRWKGGITLTPDKVLLLFNLIENKKYSGIDGMIRLAKETDVKNLSVLYSIFEREDWRRIRLPINQYTKVKSLIKNEEYNNKEGMIRLALDAKIGRIGALYDAFPEISKNWSQIELSTKNYLKAKKLLKKDKDKYVGLQGMIKLAKELNTSSLRGLCFAFPEMEWRRTNVPLNTLKKIRDFAYKRDCLELDKLSKFFEYKKSYIKQCFDEKELLIKK